MEHGERSVREPRIGHVAFSGPDGYRDVRLDGCQGGSGKEGGHRPLRRRIDDGATLLAGAESRLQHGSEVHRRGRARQDYAKAKGLRGMNRARLRGGAVRWRLPTFPNKKPVHVGSKEQPDDDTVRRGRIDAAG